LKGLLRIKGRFQSEALCEGLPDDRALAYLGTLDSGQESLDRHTREGASEDRGLEWGDPAPCV
jgi:hypothetical protein